jgi:hypothetical protein
MAKSWEEMIAEQKLEWLRHEVGGINARVDEVAGVIVELEKQIGELRTALGRQTGQQRPVLKVGRK